MLLMKSCQNTAFDLGKNPARPVCPQVMRRLPLRSSRISPGSFKSLNV
ncbi:hypothetical protein [Tautonia sociabilis]|nr:hypothetical protein [Tautonia sociabilis]